MYMIGVNIAVLDPTPQVLQFKARFSKLGRLLPKGALPLTGEERNLSTGSCLGKAADFYSLQ